MLNYSKLIGTTEYYKFYSPCNICGKNRKGIIKIVGKDEIKINCVCDCERAEYEKQREKDIKKDKQLKENQFLNSILLDKSFTRFKFSDDDGRNKQVTDFCKKYIEYVVKYKDSHSRRCLNIIFYGNCGRGKSFYSSCIANELNDKDIAALMISFPELIAHMNDERGKNEIKILNIIKHIPMLIIDDYGVELRSPANIEKMMKIFDARYRANKPLIITTNKFLDDLEMDNDLNFVRIHRRILENCKTVLIGK